MSIRLASSLFTLSVLSILFPSNAHAETPQGITAPRVATAASPAKEIWAPTYRLGIEGGTVLGRYSSGDVTTGLRIELLPSSETSILARLSYLHGPDAKGLFEGGVPIATLGFRHYSGVFYVGAEVGAVFESDSWPMLQGSFGAKAGPLDFGVILPAPVDVSYVDVGFSIGLDLFSLSESNSSSSKPRKAGTAVAVRAPSSQR